jgi:hypothetical protein
MMTGTFVITPACREWRLWIHFNMSIWHFFSLFYRWEGNVLVETHVLAALHVYLQICRRALRPNWLFPSKQNSVRRRGPKYGIQNALLGFMNAISDFLCKNRSNRYRRRWRWQFSRGIALNPHPPPPPHFISTWNLPWTYTSWRSYCIFTLLLGTGYTGQIRTDRFF